MDREKEAVVGFMDHPVQLCPGNMLVHAETLPLTADRPPVCTWPLTDVAGRAKLHRLIAGSSIVLWDETADGPFDFEITDMAASYSSFEPEDSPGEVVEGPMFYLVGPMGDYHTGSPMVYRSLQQLAFIEGMPPWNPPVILRAQRVMTRSRRQRLAVLFMGRGTNLTKP